MKRYLGIFPVLLACGLFIAGCGGGGSDSSSDNSGGGSDTSGTPWVGSWQMTDSETDGTPPSGYTGTFTFDSGGTFTLVIVWTTIGLDCTRTGSYTANSSFEYALTTKSVTGCEQIKDQHADEDGRFEFSNGNDTLTIYPNGYEWTKWDRIS